MRVYVCVCVCIYDFLAHALLKIIWMSYAEPQLSSFSYNSPVPLCMVNEDNYIIYLVLVIICDEWQMLNT